MDGVSSITASGLGLLAAADQRLARSAQTFARSAARDDAADASAADAAADPAASATEDVVDAAVGVIYGRSAFQIGVKLIEVGRDTEKSLLDIVA